MPLELEFSRLKNSSSAQDSGPKQCEWPDCQEDGLHRAPKSRDELNQFRWFCTLHVREYNKSWNYYKGMSDEEVEADVREDTVWHRPSWRIGTNGSDTFTYQGGPEYIRDPFDILKNVHMDGRTTAPQETTLSAEQIKALHIFELDKPGTLESLKLRYKELVKRHHPDAKGASAASEEKMKDINQAYKTLVDFIGR